MKKFLSFILAFVLSTCCLFTAVHAVNDVSVTVNGNPVVWQDAKPFIDDSGRTMVPLRAVADAMGITVEWNGDARTASFIYETAETETRYGTRLSISFPIGSSSAHCAQYFSEGERRWLNWQESLEMDTAAVIIHDSTFAPIRYMAEFFGFTVDWDANTRTVMLASPLGYVSYYEPVGIYPNQITIAWDPGEIYDELESFGVISAAASGVDSDFYVWSKSEIDALNSTENEDYFYVITVYGDFGSDSDIAEISWIADWSYTDGTSERINTSDSFPLKYGGARAG